MGRGRAKAKQTKVARELKYSSHHTDLSALQRELSGSPQVDGAVDSHVDDSLDGVDGSLDGYDERDDWASSRH